MNIYVTGLVLFLSISVMAYSDGETNDDLEEYSESHELAGTLRFG